MKKFLVLPIVAALAACSSNDDKVAVPVQPQPVLTASQTGHSGHTHAETPKKEAEAVKKQEQVKPKPVNTAPVYAPHTPHYVSSPLPPVPVPPHGAQTPVVPQPKADPAPVVASPQVQQAAQQVFQPTATDGNFKLPEENLVKAGTTVTGLNSAAIPAAGDDKVKLYNKDNTSVYVFDGFKHQAFGGVFENKDLKGYISTGTRYTPKDKELYSKGRAKYKGIAIGTYDKNNDVISKVDAQLVWEPSDKYLEVTTSNSQIVKTNAQGSVNPSKVKSDDFNFTEKMTWQDADKHFKSSDGSIGYIYGKDKAEEVGGILKREVTISDTKDKVIYEGAFGASNTLKP